MRHCVCLMCLLYACVELYAVDTDTLAARIDYQRWSFPQEKIHVMTDQGGYVAGDTIRFRSFVVDAASHRPVSISRYVYVGLIDPFGRTVKQVKIRESDGVYAGYIPLAQDMAEGDYTLAAYTRFMESLPQDMFFRKNVYVSSPYSAVNILDGNFSREGDDVVLSVGLIEASTREPVSRESLTVVTASGKVYEGGRGAKRRKFRIKSSDIDNGVLLVSADNMSKYFNIPQDSAAIHVGFYPEGGYLVPEESCALAYKVTDGLGHGVNIEGQIVDSLGSVVADFGNSHYGMGVVRFVPQPSMSYYAMIGGKCYVLPVANPMAAVLQVDNSRKNGVTVSAVGNVPAGTMLVAQNRGRFVWAGPIGLDSPVSFLREVLGEGVVQFLLIDNNGMTLSERLIFSRPPGSESLMVDEADLTDTVKFKLSLSGDDNLADVAISVTSNSLAIPDTATSIAVSLLLQSDLRGYIEDPGYYFRNSGRMVTVHLDALMLTQGWTRYDIPGAMSGEFTEPKSELEQGPVISGMIKSRWRGKPLAGAQINIIAPSMGYAGTSLTDENGCFYHTGFDWPDGTHFAIQALNRNGGYEDNFTVDEDRYPVVDALPPSETFSCNDVSDGQAIAHVVGRLGVNLHEVVVRGRRKPTDEVNVYEMLGARSLDEKDIENRKITTYEEALRLFPGIRIEQGRVRKAGASSIFGKKDDVEFWVDGVRWSPSYVDNGDIDVIESQKVKIQAQSDDPSNAVNAATAKKAKQFTGGLVPSDVANDLYTSFVSVLNEFSSSYPFHVIARIDYLNPGAATVVSSTAAHGGGALIFTTKKGAAGMSLDKALHIQIHSPLGYQKPVERYKPDVPYIPVNYDMERSVLLWMPSVRIAAEPVIISVPAMAKGRITVNVQGVTADGRVVTMVKAVD